MSRVVGALEKLASQINGEINRINSGGCCVFASMAYPYLKEMGLKPKIRVSGSIYNKRKILGRVRNKIEDTGNVHHWWEEGISFRHVLNEIEIKGEKYFFDAYGVVKVEKKSKIEPFCHGLIQRGHLMYEEAVQIAACPDGWNPTFNRGDIGKMATLLEKGFMKLMKEFA